MRSRTFNKLAAIAMATAGCAVQGSAGEKSGAAAEPAALRLGTVENQTAPYADEVEEFARSVESSTGGSIDIEIAWEAIPFSPDSERQLATMVGEGEIDLAVVPTRAWDLLGVSSMRALQAPFLVDSLSLVNEIVAGDLADDMFTGLDEVGVAGLAMWPEGLRHPVAFADPVLTAADFDGARLRVPTSDASNRLAAALGAVPVNPPNWEAAVGAGELDAMESAFVWSFEYPVLGTFTGNITFYPKVNTIVANAATFDGLTSDQQQTLREAALGTVDYVIETNATEHDLAVLYCAAGGSVALAEESDLAELVALAAPVVDELEADTDTARLIAEIQAMKDGGAATDPADSASACEPAVEDDPATDDGSATSVAEDAVFPEGVYRAVFREDANGIEQEPAVMSMRFEDGNWLWQEPGVPDCGGTYVVEADRISFAWSIDPALSELPNCGGEAGGCCADAVWSYDDGVLRFLDVNGPPGADWLLASEPWTKTE